MSDVRDTEAPISDEQLLVDEAAMRARVRHLYAVPDDSADRPSEPGEGWIYEPPDVIGAQQVRDEYRQAMPSLSDEELDSYVDRYAHNLKPNTRRSYESALRPFYQVAARLEFNPLTCAPVMLEAHIQFLMDAGKIGADGSRNPKEPYSTRYFHMFIAAHKAATEAKGLPEVAGGVRIKKLQRGYTNTRGSELPRRAKNALRLAELVDIERNLREGATAETATVRAAVALGSDPHLKLGAARLCRLKFADVALHQDRAVLTTTSRGCPEKVIVMAQPGDAACPVTALKTLREARYNVLRARSGSPPTTSQVDSQSLFTNARSQKPLTPPGLQHIVNSVCAGVVGDVTVAGGLPLLTPQLRREVLAPRVTTKVARDLMMISHTAFSSARVGEAASFDVGDVRVFGCDHNGRDTLILLVDETLRDGTVVKGMLSRIAAITETDIVDHSGRSLYGSGIIMGVYNRFKHGTKTKDYHENWYPAQPGHPACPVRLLLQGVAAYDRQMVALNGRRLSVEDWLFTQIKRPGQGFTANQLSRALGKVVKAAVEGLGLDPSRYSAHSLRKFRSTYIHSIGGSQLNAMLHDARSSEASNLPYVQTDPRSPFSGDPMVGILDNVGTLRPKPVGVTNDPLPSALTAAKSLPTQTRSLPGGRSEAALSPVQHQAVLPDHTRGALRDAATVPLQAAASPPVEPPGQESANSSTPARVGSDGAADPPNTDMQSIAALQGVIGRLRSAGFDDSEIAALVGLRLT